MIIIVEGGDCASFFARMSVGERGERTNERTKEPHVSLFFLDILELVDRHYCA